MSKEQILKKENETGAMNMRTEVVRLDEIDFADTGFQIRATLDDATLKEYVGVIKATRRLEGFTTRPVLWKRPDGRFRICDGWHRLNAAKECKVADVDADVISGSEYDALAMAMGSNLKHGLRLKPEEKIEACRRFVEAFTDKAGAPPSDAVIGESLHISESSARSYRRKLEGDNKLPRATESIGRDGIKQPAKKAAKTAAKPQQVSAKATKVQEGAPAAQAQPAMTEPVSKSAVKLDTVPGTSGDTDRSKLKAVADEVDGEPVSNDSRIRGLTEDRSTCQEPHPVTRRASRGLRGTTQHWAARGRHMGPTAGPPTTSRWLLVITILPSKPWTTGATWAPIQSPSSAWTISRPES